MSAIETLGGTANPASTTNAFQAMTSEDFIRVMFSELTNQDPLSPNDSQALLNQISTIRSIEADIGLGQRLEEIALQNEISSAGTLLGSFVSGLDASGNEVVGFVDSVSVTREGSVLNLSTGYSVALDRVVEIIDPDLIRAVEPNDSSGQQPTPTEPDPDVDPDAEPEPEPDPTTPV